MQCPEGMPFPFRTYTTPWIIFMAHDTSRQSIYSQAIYWQLGVTDRAKERSAFWTRRGLCQFTRMPFGLAGSPASFCILMSTVFKDHLCKHTVAVWCSGNMLVLINAVALHRARLVLGWMGWMGTTCDRTGPTATSEAPVSRMQSRPGTGNASCGI